MKSKILPVTSAIRRKVRKARRFYKNSGKPEEQYSGGRIWRIGPFGTKIMCRPHSIWDIEGEAPVYQFKDLRTK